MKTPFRVKYVEPAQAPKQQIAPLPVLPIPPLPTQRQTSSGVWLALLTFFFAAMTNACVKIARESIPSLEIVFLRSLIGAVVLIAVVGRYPLSSLVAKGTIKFHFARAILGVMAMCCFAYAFKHLKLADATAISFTNPLFLAILARMFLKEQIPRARWLAIALGFLGVLLVANPEHGGISLAATVLIFGCVVAAASDIFVRILAGSQSSSSIVLIFSILSSVMLLPAIPLIWKNPEPFAWVVIVLIGFGGIATQLLLTKALQLIPASLVAPFSYTSLAWVMILGFLLWGDMPTTRGVIGTLFIIADGCLAALTARSSSKNSSA